MRPVDPRRGRTVAAQHAAELKRLGVPDTKIAGAIVDATEGRVVRASARRDDPEHREQVRVIEWWDGAIRDGVPVPGAHLAYGLEIADLFAVPNFARVSARWGAYMRAEGKRAGVCDLMLLAPRGPWAGWLCEMKTAKGRPTPEQRAFLERHARRGYCAGVAVGADAAIASLTTYLTLDSAPAGRAPTPSED